jgi:hypothetical protein
MCYPRHAKSGAYITGMKTDSSQLQEIQPVETKPDSVTKRQIFGKVRRKMIELGFEKSDSELSINQSESPDVIVISDDSSLLFEPQNLRVIEWLHRRFGVNDLQVRDRLRAHPLQCQEIVGELKAAGFEVAY